MLRKWFKQGKIGAPQLQQAAAESVANGDRRTIISKLAHAGRDGAIRGNISRDVMKHIGSSKTKPYCSLVTFWDPDRNCQIKDKCFFLLPYEIIESEIDAGTPIDDFCHLADGDPLISVKADLMRTLKIEDGSNVALIGLWGDAAPFHNRDSVFLVLFNVISGSRAKRFPISCWSKRMSCNCGCSGRHTMDDIWRVCAWFMTAWLSGEHPSYRDDNTLFEDSIYIGDKARARRAKFPLRTKGLGAQLRADWRFHKQAFELTGWTPEGPLGRVCMKCFANCSTIPHTDPSLEALWRFHMLTHQIFMQLQLADGKYISSIWNLPGLKTDHVTIDLMHTGCLGALLYTHGNVLWEIFEEVGGLTTRPGAALGDIIMMIKSASKAVGQTRPHINKITLPMIRDGAKTPELKVKAAESRYMLKCIRHILENYMPMDSPHQQRRYQCVKTIDELYRMMALPVGEFKGMEAAKLVRRFLILNADLGNESLERRVHLDSGMLFWRWMPKFHLFSHFEQQIAVSGNPSRHWCYMDESLIGDVVNICEACHPSTLHRLVLQKMLIS